VSALSSLVAAAPRYAGLLASQRWSRDRLEAYRRTRLEATLAAAGRIPFYAARLGGVRRADELPDLPVLERRDVEQLARSVRERAAGARLAADRSSGSTGMPAEFYFDEAHQRGRFAARARYLRAHGWSPLARNGWVIFLPAGSPDATLVARRCLAATRFLSYLTPFAEQVRWLERLRPRFLYSFPSNLDGLLSAIEARGARLPELRCVLSGSEVLTEELRARVRRVLGVPVADNYGSTEAFLAWQCPAGSYHVNAEHVHLEIVDDCGAPAPPGTMGRVLVTTLENALMPLVRYAIGDYAVAAAGACPCGRTLPLIGAVAGRSINLFRRSSGELFTPWSLIGALKNCTRLRQFQLAQRDVHSFTVRYAADEELDEVTENAIRRQIASRLGEPAQVSFERVAEVPRSATGKYRTAVCELPNRL
jgi:phenylacetate-coenzyme A ligase PaaK-like adenylate-forming protein